MVDASLWIKRFAEAPDASARLLCLPFVGGGASAFRPWALALAPGIEVFAAALPGRESRRRERPANRLEPTVEALFEAWVAFSQDGAPPALFGHSMGALLALELAHRFRDRLGAEPPCLFVAGQVPPDRPTMDRVHNLPHEAFVERLKALGGTPKEVFEHEELLCAILPVLRADFEACAQHGHRDVPPLTCPIVAFAGRNDGYAPGDTLSGWARLTGGRFELCIVEGDHFFVHASREALLEAMRVELVSSA